MEYVSPVNSHEDGLTESEFFNTEKQKVNFRATKPFYKYRLGIIWNDREKIDIQLKFSGMVVERMTNTMAESVPQISIGQS